MVFPIFRNTASIITYLEKPYSNEKGNKAATRIFGCIEINQSKAVLCDWLIDDFRKTHPLPGEPRYLTTKEEAEQYAKAAAALAPQDPQADQKMTGP